MNEKEYHSDEALEEPERRSVYIIVRKGERERALEAGTPQSA
jgi:hypothetical protein